MANRVKKPTLQLPTPLHLRIGIARSTFHDDITQQLLQEAERFLHAYNIPYDVVTATGSFELSYILKQMAQSDRYQALVALGCLIKGETIHFDVVAQATAQGIMNSINTYNIPIGFGVITATDKTQALERTWIGYDATYAAVECYINTRQYHKQKL